MGVLYAEHPRERLVFSEPPRADEVNPEDRMDRAVEAFDTAREIQREGGYFGVVFTEKGRCIAHGLMWRWLLYAETLIRSHRWHETRKLDDSFAVALERGEEGR